MLWLKILVAVAVVAAGTLGGYFAANKYRARKKFYTQFSAFNERYLNELNYARKPLDIFLKQYAYTGDFAKALKGFSERRDTKICYSYLTGEERAECADYFAMLGNGDSLSQKNFFAAKQAGIEEKRAASEREAKERGALYLKLGIMAGLAVVILIV